MTLLVLVDSSLSSLSHKKSIMPPWRWRGLRPAVGRAEVPTQHHNRAIHNHQQQNNTSPSWQANNSQRRQNNSSSRWLAYAPMRIVTQLNNLPSIFASSCKIRPQGSSRNFAVTPPFLRIKRRVESVESYTQVSRVGRPGG